MHRIAVLCGLIFGSMMATVMPAQGASGIGYSVPACTGSAATDTTTLKNAFARGGLLQLPACEYVVSGTLRLKNGTQLIGAGYASTVIRSVITDGRPLIDTDPAKYTSGVRIAGIGFRGPFGNGKIGTGDAFLLHAVTNISVFEQVSIANFGGNGFTIKRQTGNAGDPLGIFNAEFNSIFVNDVGGYAFDIYGRVHATWNKLEVNSPGGGAFRFRKGGSNNSFINISDFVAQWHDSWSSKAHVVVFDIADYQVINLVNCVLSVSSAATATNLTFIRTNSTFHPNLASCSGQGTPFKYWVANTKFPNQNILYKQSITYRF